MKFSVVGEYFQQIEQTSSRLSMTELLAVLLKKATPSEAAIISNLSLGQLHPPHIGTQFNIAETLMLNVVADILDQPAASIDTLAKKHGDLGTVIEAGSWKASDDLSVHDVYKALCTVEELSGAGSQDDKREALVALLLKLDQTAAKFVVRIVIGKLRLGFSDMTLVDALSWMEVGDKSERDTIENAYNLCADIGYIATLIKEQGIDALRRMQVKVGTPIRPAGAERLPTTKAIIEKLGPCVAQPKIDGFRLQIHLDKTAKKTPSVHFFSRHLTDMSFMFPDLTKAIGELDVETMIAEGEAIVYDPDAQTYLPFQETVKRRRKHDIAAKAAELPLQIIFFDLLYLNGQDLLGKGYEERRALLISLFSEQQQGVMRVIEEKSMRTAQELENYFTSCITAGLEGLVVKRPNAPYQAGKRNFNWIKLKRQETGHLEDTIDSVVLGYYAGSGKRAQFGIGAFLVGIYNKKEDCFETVAKVGTGLKDADWVDLKKKCDELAVKSCPKNVVCAKELYPDVWVSPELTALIRADEITLSPVHSAGKTGEHPGYALRFPRFMGYRPDKGPTEATTVTEIIRLYKDQFEQ